MLDKKIVSSSLSFTLVKYLNLLIGFLRTTFVAITLTKNSMGELVIIYLIIEYMSYLFSFGLPNSINLQISIDKNLFKKFDYKKLRVKKYYSIFFLIVFFSSIILYLSLFLITNFFSDYLKESVNNHYNKIFIVIFLYAIKLFTNIHNRLWEKAKNIIFSDLIFSVSYFFGLFFLLESNLNDPIDLVLKVVIFSQILAILIANVQITFEHLIKFDKEKLSILFPLGFLLMLQHMMELYFWGIDRLFISFYLNNEDLASFHLAHTYARGLMLFFTAGTFLIYPRMLTTLSSLKTPNYEIKQIIDKAFSIAETILIFVFLITITIVPYFMNLIFIKYDNFFYIFVLIIFGLIIKSLTFFPVSFIVSRKKQKKLILNSLIFLFALIFLYGFLNKYNLIKNAEEFTLTAIFIFLLFSIRIYYWSMTDLKIQNVSIITFNKFWRITLLYLIIFISYFFNLNQLNAIIYILILSSLMYWKLFLINFKIVYSILLNIYSKKIKSEAS